jgi:exopolyphosphatase
MFKLFLVFVSILAFALSLSLNAKVADYLQTTHAQMRALKINERLPHKMVHVVLGNQSADMDSIVSAIAFASASRDHGFYVPLINIQSDELSLRRDVLYLFETLGIDRGSILYKEDLPFLQKFAEQGYLRVTIVDHNHLAPDQEFLKDYVERIFDHHQDENDAYPHLEEKRVMRVKSNATIIAERICNSCSQEEAYLLLSAILLDTKNLKDGSTENDIAMAKRMRECAGVDSDLLFDILSEQRHSVEHLTADLLLKRDYKLYKEGKLLYGMASIPKGILWTVNNRAEWKEAFIQSLEKQDIHLLCAKIHERNEGALIIYIPSQHLQKAFLAHIKATTGLNEILNLKDYFPEEGLFFFVLQPSLGRKELQPLWTFEKSSIIQNAL